MGRGSLDFAKQLVAEEALGQPSSPRDTLVAESYMQSNGNQ